MAGPWAESSTSSPSPAPTIFHGSVYDYLQNSATDARSLLQPAPLPHALRQNQFGGTLGGPIRKDRTFFFLNYEGQRRAESPTYAPDLVNNIADIDQAKAYLGLSPEGCNLPPAQCTGSPFSYLQSTSEDGTQRLWFCQARPSDQHQQSPGDPLRGGGCARHGRTDRQHGRWRRHRHSQRRAQSLHSRSVGGGHAEFGAEAHPWSTPPCCSMPDGTTTFPALPASPI